MSPFSSKRQGRPSASQEPSKEEICHTRDDFRSDGWGCSFWTWKTHRGIRMAPPALESGKGGDIENWERESSKTGPKFSVGPKHGLEKHGLVRNAPDTFNFLRHVIRAILSVQPKCSHGCISLKETPFKPVQILKHTTRNSAEQTAMRTKWFKHIAI